MDENFAGELQDTLDGIESLKSRLALADALAEAAREVVDWYADTHKEPMWTRLRKAIVAFEVGESTK